MSPGIMINYFKYKPFGGGVGMINFGGLALKRPQTALIIIG